MRANVDSEKITGIMLTWPSYPLCYGMVYLLDCPCCGWKHIHLRLTCKVRQICLVGKLLLFLLTGYGELLKLRSNIYVTKCLCVALAVLGLGM